jgi:hypothetical protein
VTDYSYLAFAYRQALDASAPYLLSFVAPVDEIREWAGVPRRDRSDGFQRLDDPARVGTIQNFFRLTDSQSPTSIVVGVTDNPIALGSVQVTPLYALDDYAATDFGVSALSATPPSRSVDSLGRTTAPILCRVTFRTDPDEPIDAIAERYRLEIESRISDEPEDEDSAEDEQQLDPDDELPVAADDGTLAEAGMDNPDEGLVEAEASENSGGAAGLEDSPAPTAETDLLTEDVLTDRDDSLDIRDSSLRRLAKRLAHPTWVRARESDIRDLAKPATIIDGQHRVLGSSRLGGGIPFNVVALMDAAWAEQVFQFTILNYTARPLPGQFIAGNAAITLTTNEMASLRDRLKTAGLKVKDVDIFSAIGADSRSPFYDLISVQERSAANKLGYGTMVSIGAQWMDAKPQFLQELLDILYPGTNARARLETWRAGVWQSFFWAFWDEVRATYEGNDPDLWVPGAGHRLMITAVLKILQDEIFRVFDGQLNFWLGVPADQEKAEEHLRANVKTVLQWVPADLFKSQWTVSGIQGSSSDREKVRNVIEQLLTTRGRFTWRRSQLLQRR